MILHLSRDFVFVGRTTLQPIQRTPEAQSAAIHHVRVGHRRAHISVPQQLLDSRMSKPASSRRVANECRNVCQPTRIITPAAFEALRQPETGAIQQRRHQPRHARQLIQHKTQFL